MNMDLNDLTTYINTTSEDSKIYIGADSERLKKNGLWYADYAVVVVVHINGNNGCKIFGEITRERDYDQKVEKPAIRLMNEVYKAQVLYSKIADIIGNRHCEIHLDINPQEKYGSSCVIQQAIGYIRGTCDKDPIVKPYAFAASVCADRLKELMAA
jgi:predicted RNase H-related nuclease YkuK (DUF458 family)